MASFMLKSAVLAPLFLLYAPALLAQMPEPEHSRFYLSQGEWKGAALTESGQEIVLEVVKSAASMSVTVFDINALADMGATPLSHRRIWDARLATVREELVHKGVPPGEIAVQEVRTADGSVPRLSPDAVRRVVIVVHY
jgi:hypothetical protein